MVVWRDGWSAFNDRKDGSAVIMTINLEEMKKRLLQRRSEIVVGGEGDLSEVKPRLVNSDEADDDTKDMEDYAVDVTERVTEESIAMNDQALVDQIDAALKRIEDGTYGRCEVDGAPIPEKRLEAIPWASRCAKHEEELEQRNLSREELISHDRDTHYA